MSSLINKIVLKDEGDSGEEASRLWVSSSAQAACQICFKDEGRYRCPRCELRYCSKPCFQDEKHAECSEEFFKNSVMDVVSHQRATEDEKRELLKLIKRMNDAENEDSAGEESDEGEDGPDLEALLRDIDLGKADVSELWEVLDEAQRADFEKALADGRLGNMVALWDPWWTQPEAPRPRPSRKAHKWSEVAGATTRPPAKELRYNLVDLLYSYAYTMRAFNGDTEDAEDAFDASRCAAQLSAVLTKNAVHASVDIAIKECMLNARERASQGQEPLWNPNTAVSDVASILSTLDDVAAALSDLHSLLLRGKSACKKLSAHDTTDQLAEEYRAMFGQFSRKIAYFLAWVGERFCSDDVSCHVVLKQLRDETDKVIKGIKADSDAIEAAQGKPGGLARKTRSSAPLIPPSTAPSAPKADLPGGGKPRKLITEL